MWTFKLDLQIGSIIVLHTLPRRITNDVNMLKWLCFKVKLPCENLFDFHTIIVND